MIRRTDRQRAIQPIKMVEAYRVLAPGGILKWSEGRSKTRRLERIEIILQALREGASSTARRLMREYVGVRRMEGPRGSRAAGCRCPDPATAPHCRTGRGNYECPWQMGYDAKNAG